VQRHTTFLRFCHKPASFPQAIRGPTDSLSVALGESRIVMGSRVYDGTASPKRWSIDGVDFDVATVWGLTIARGRFDRVAGSYEVGPESTKIELTVDAGSLVTRNGIWDNLLRSTEPSGIAEHPEVRFTSTHVRDSGHGKLHVEGRVAATGKVVPVEFDAVVQRVDHGLQLEAAATVDRQHLGEIGGQLGMILPATVHVRAHLTGAQMLQAWHVAPQL
jgi:polyisoprenoid-binding protein YceI